MEQLRELPQFFQHANPEVRKQALLILQGLIGNPEALKIVKEQNMVPLLCRLASDPKVGIEALRCLVNLGGDDDECIHQMIDSAIISICMEQLREKDSHAIDLAVMLLANVTRNSEDAAKALMQESDEKLVGLHVRRLIAYLAQTPQEDKYDYIAYILVNITKLQSGQKMLMENNTKVLKLILPQLRIGGFLSEVRVEGVFMMIRNLFAVPKYVEALLKEELGLLSLLLIPLCGPGDIDDEDLDEMPWSVREAWRDKGVTRRIKSEKIRTIILETLLFGLKSNRDNRQYLRSKKIYYIIREMHKEELEKKNNVHDVLIEDLVHYLHLADPDLENGEQVVEEEEGQAPLEEGKMLNPLFPDKYQDPADLAKVAELEVTEEEEALDLLGEVE